MTRALAFRSLRLRRLRRWASRTADWPQRIRRRAAGPCRSTSPPTSRGHNGRSSVALSPDGQWVAHTVETEDTVPRATHQYSATGFPFAEGDSRMEATSRT